MYITRGIQITLCTFCFLLLPALADAHRPIVMTPEGVADVRVVSEPEISRAFYGELDNFPHTFEIRATSSFHLYVQVLEPDKDEAKNDHTGIIIRERDDGRGVEEVARLRPAEASWESFYEFFGGDSYLEGPKFDAEVGPGVYRVEVSTPVNDGKYVLAIGKTEDFSGMGYFGILKGIYSAKQMMGRSPLTMLYSPFVFVPILVLFIAFVAYRQYKKYYG